MTIEPENIEEFETESAVADAGTWVTIEGPGVGLMVEVLVRDHNVSIVELREVKPWVFRARVVNYNQEGFQLRGFSINDGTYVSEVDGEQVQEVTPQVEETTNEFEHEVEAGDAPVRD